MRCREFRDKHVAFVDDLLSAVEMGSMQQHVYVCPRCSRHDTAVRRSLMLVRNLPTIEPSPDFMARLNLRLLESGPVGIDRIAPRPYFPSIRTFAALAAGVATVGYLALQTTRYFAPVPAASLGPLMAAIPDATSPMNNAAIVASVPTAMPLWPAVLMAGQAPIHIASLDFRETK